MADIQNSTNASKWRSMLQAELESMPLEYGSFYEAVSELQHAVMEDIATAVQRRLNRHLRNLPQNSLEDKRNLAWTVNQDLRRLHLCLRCPTSGLPAILVGSYRDKEEQSSRFRFGVHEDGRTVQKGVFYKLPTLEVIESRLRIEPFAHDKGRGR